jgi:hypothetical protein
MTVKSEMIAIMQDEGYDLITAAEHVTQALKEFRESGKESETYTVGNTRFTIKNDR